MVVALAVVWLVSVCRNENDMLEVGVCDVSVCDEDCVVKVEIDAVVTVFVTPLIVV